MSGIRGTHHKAGVFEFLLAKNGFLCLRFDPQMLAMREKHRHVALQTEHISGSGSSVLAHSCWSGGGSIAPLVRFFVPVHSCGQDDTLARSYSARLRRHRRLRMQLPCCRDGSRVLAFRRHNHQRQGTVVRVHINYYVHEPTTLFFPRWHPNFTKKKICRHGPRSVTDTCLPSPRHPFISHESLPLIELMPRVGEVNCRNCRTIHVNSLNLAFYIYAVPGVFVTFFCFECVPYWNNCEKLSYLHRSNTQVISKGLW